MIALLIAFSVLVPKLIFTYAIGSDVNNIKGVNCASPPPNFDLVHASENEIMYYGLPPRPQGSLTALNDWINLVSVAKHRDCNLVKSVRYSQTLQSKQIPHKKIFNGGATPYLSHPSTSSVWSGYIVGDGTGNGFKQLEGNWNVPCYNGSKSPSNSRAISWIGLGGYYGNNLWQGGTTEDPVDGYHLWFEQFPYETMQVDSTNLSCADHIQAEADYGVTLNSGGTAPQVYIYIVDTNNGHYISATSIGQTTWKPDLLSAEWIEERTQCSFSPGTHFKLADFNNVQWSNGQAVLNQSGANYKPISTYYNIPLTMKEGSTSITQIGSLTGNGGSFQDNWLGNGNDANC